MPTITITWDATLDERTCKICKALHGYTWTFEVGKDPMTDEPVHPQYGVVWNKQIGSQAHGHERYNCRCHITPTIDLSDVKQKIQKIKTDIEANTPEQLR